MKILKRFKNKAFKVKQSHIPSHKLPSHIKERVEERKRIDNAGKIDLKDVTFMIPLRIDSEDRKRCVTIVIDYLLKHFDTNITVLEEGKSSFFPGIKKPEWSDVTYIFRKSQDELFHKTLNLNIMTKNSKTPIVCAMDSDCLFYPFQYYNAVQKIRNSTLDFCYPFNQPNHNIAKSIIPDLQSSLDLSSVHSRTKPTTSMVPPGGCFIMNKALFIQAGMENQHMISYGPEDMERRDRLLILGYKVGNVEGPLFHVDHDRTINSNDHNPLFGKNQEEHNKVRFMSAEQLRKYVATWGWNK